MPTLYVTEEMLAASIGLPPDLLPAAMHVTPAASPAGPDRSAPAWKLTAALYWRLWRAVAALEFRWARGEVKADVMAEAYQRWQAIDAWAEQHIGQAQLREARPPYDYQFGRLPTPPLQRDGWTPFDSPPTPLQPTHAPRQGGRR